MDRNTYRVFQLEDGVPTDVYGLDDAAADDWLVPPRAVTCRVYSDFEDELGRVREIDAPSADVGTDMERFTAEAPEFLRGHLTANGVVEPGALFGSPFTDHGGPTEHFDDAEVHELMDRLREVEARATVTTAADVQRGA